MSTIWNSRETLAWFAGMYEGEGCLTIRKKDSARTGQPRTSLTVSIKMTDRDVVEHIHEAAVVELAHEVELGGVRLKNLCGVKHCVRPEHWGRDARYLEDEQVCAARAMLDEGATSRTVADRFGVSLALVSDIRNGRRRFATPKAS